jgi:hypothetical protein
MEGTCAVCYYRVYAGQASVLMNVVDEISFNVACVKGE